MLRLGFISRWDVYDPSAMSGMPSAAWAALKSQGVELTHLNPGDCRKNGLGHLGSILRSSARPFVSDRYRSMLRKKLADLNSRVPWPNEYKRVIANATKQSHVIQEMTKFFELDALLGICISTELYNLQTELPIIYVSDATARLINESYPEFMNRPRSYRIACDDIERQSLSHVSAGLFSSDRTRQSAIDDYGFSADRAFVVPLGATVLPTQNNIERSIDPPSFDRLELVIVASDPTRKRLNFCIDVVQELEKRGITVCLNYIGPPTQAALHSPLVNCVGALKLSDPADREKHEQILRRSHILILPSMGEMYGIAPCEAAHFGKPSIVSNVGGLPTVVQHGQTGIVLPVEATSNSYADEIEKLCRRPELYRRMSDAAICRARKVLNWDAWAKTTISITRKLIEQRRSQHV